MSKSLPLKEMTLQEKLSAMELLWDDLTRSPDTIESPEWHQTTLDDRRQQVAEGTAQFSDWESAKVAIRSKIR